MTTAAAKRQAPKDVESLRATIKLALDGLEQMTSRDFSEGRDRYIRDALREALGIGEEEAAAAPQPPICPRCNRPATGWSLKRPDICSPKDWAQCIRQMADVEADIIRRAEKKKQRGATKAQLAHRAARLGLCPHGKRFLCSECNAAARGKLFAPASPSIHDDLAALKVVR